MTEHRLTDEQIDELFDGLAKVALRLPYKDVDPIAVFGNLEWYYKRREFEETRERLFRAWAKRHTEFPWYFPKIRTLAAPQLSEAQTTGHQVSEHHNPDRTI